jgi:hypothetical protein
MGKNVEELKKSRPKNYEINKKGRRIEKKELLNKEEEYLKEQVYSYKDTEHAKQNAHIIISKPTQ